MNDPSTPDRSPSDLFEDLCNRGGVPDPYVFLTQFPNICASELGAVLRKHLGACFRNGQLQRVEEYFERLPQLVGTEAEIDLAYSEYLLRTELGMADATQEEFLKRFPRIAEILNKQIEIGRIFQDHDAESTKVLCQANENEAANLDSDDEIQMCGSFGRYQIDSLLGRGGMGRVYLAYDTVLQRRVAVKVPSAQLQKEPLSLKRFTREARTSAQLDHPNIAAVYDAGVINNTHFLSMEYVPGTNLGKMLYKQCPMPPDQAVAVFKKIVAAIHYAHENGVIHRDIKPANILMRDGIEPVIADFGLAHCRSLSTEDLSSHGAFIGTPAYAAPEQIDGTYHPPSKSMDYYSLGAIFFHMLTGKPPYLGTPSSVIHKTLVSQVPTPSFENANIPPSLDAITQRLLQKNPDDRYGDLLELLQDLESYKMEPKQQSRPPILTRRFALYSVAIVLALVATAPFLLYFVSPPRALVPIPSQWSGTFTFDQQDYLPAELSLVSVTEDQQIKAIYRTEDKYEWVLLGREQEGRIAFRFIEAKNEETSHLLDHGKLDCRVSNNHMVVHFADSSDLSSASFEMQRQ